MTDETKSNNDDLDKAYHDLCHCTCNDSSPVEVSISKHSASFPTNDTHNGAMLPATALLVYFEIKCKNCARTVQAFKLDDAVTLWNYPNLIKRLNKIEERIDKLDLERRIHRNDICINNRYLTDVLSNCTSIMRNMSDIFTMLRHAKKIKSMMRSIIADIRYLLMTYQPVVTMAKDTPSSREEQNEI
jgi:hypothetical protein